MAHFSDLKRMAACLLHGITLAPTGIITGSSGGGGSVIPTVLYPDGFRVRRFGLNNAGRIVYDDFGEPVDLTAQINFIEFIQFGRIKSLHNKNEEMIDDRGISTNRTSHIGGRTSTKATLTMFIPLETNIQENDIVIFPTNTLETYRVRDIGYDTHAGRKVFTAIFESKTSR